MQEEAVQVEDPLEDLHHQLWLMVVKVELCKLLELIGFLIHLALETVLEVVKLKQQELTTEVLEVEGETQTHLKVQMVVQELLLLGINFNS